MTTSFHFAIEPMEATGNEELLKTGELGRWRCLEELTQRKASNQPERAPQLHLLPAWELWEPWECRAKDR